MEITGPWNMNEHRLVLTPTGDAVVKPVTDNFYQELDQAFGNFKGHNLVAVHEFEDSWPTWEMHPRGDEIICLISGDIEFALRRGGEDTTVRLDQPGNMIVVPKAVWHTARPKSRSRLIFMTPGEGTLNAEAPPDIA